MCLQLHMRFTAPSAVPLGCNGHLLCQTVAVEAKPSWRLLFPSELSVYILLFYPKCVGVLNIGEHIYPGNLHTYYFI